MVADSDQEGSAASAAQPQMEPAGAQAKPLNLETSSALAVTGAAQQPLPCEPIGPASSHIPAGGFNSKQGSMGGGLADYASSPLLAHNPDGTLARTTGGHFAPLAPDAVEALKTRVLEGLAAGKGLWRVVGEIGQWGTVWRLKESDPDFAEAIEHWRRGVGLKAVALMDDTLDNPAEHEEGLKYSGWSNFAMINAKAAFPDMRDSAQINVNVDARTAIGDWQAAIQAAQQADDPSVPRSDTK